MKIKIIKADYDAAIKVCPPIPWLNMSSTCLLAQAIKRVTGRTCHVGCSSVQFDDNRERFNLPENAQDAVYGFDHKRTFSGIEFEMIPIKVVNDEKAKV